MSVGGGARCAPLFVVGAARSGTTLLYHTLLSSGHYAVYLGEPAIFDLVQPRYGDLRRAASRARLLHEWPASHLARASELDDKKQALSCSPPSGVMATSTRRDESYRVEAERLTVAVWGPDNLLLMRWIKRELPDARFVHMVRDGRDVALSIWTQSWIRSFPWTVAQTS